MKKILARCAVMTAVLGSIAMAGCSLGDETPTIKNQFAIAENTVYYCTDGFDNDLDGLADCEDPDCQAVGTKEIPGPGAICCPGVTDANGIWSPAENTPFACSDGIDNDGNGFSDCHDNACKQLSVCCVKTGDENTVDACSDGIDNDCDGYADCNDYSCKGGNSKDSAATPESIAYCELSQNTTIIKGDENTLEACSDGIDNDGDGYADCNDYSCNGLGTSKDSTATPEAIAYCSVAEEKENTDATCSDKRDNDLDGLIDCDDPNCSNIAYCQDAGLEPPVRPEHFDQLDPTQRAAILAQEQLVCTDGIDNNKNGKADCDEYQCHMLSLRSQNYTGIDANYKFNCQTPASE
ncbi:MAG: hypothetical protein IKY83_09985 [Proteobacteria bacterium]|nr:hypothetical protein [Pseudomonadota bacterium]